MYGPDGRVRVCFSSLILNNYSERDDTGQRKYRLGSAWVIGRTECRLVGLGRVPESCAYSIQIGSSEIGSQLERTGDTCCLALNRFAVFTRDTFVSVFTVRLTVYVPARSDNLPNPVLPLDFYGAPVLTRSSYNPESVSSCHLHSSLTCPLTPIPPTWPSVREPISSSSPTGCL